MFPGLKPGKPLSNMAFLMLLRRMGRDDRDGAWFPLNLPDWAAERTVSRAKSPRWRLAHAIEQQSRGSISPR